METPIHTIDEAVVPESTPAPSTSSPPSTDSSSIMPESTTTAITAASIDSVVPPSISITTAAELSSSTSAPELRASNNTSSLDISPNNDDQAHNAAKKDLHVRSVSVQQASSTSPTPMHPGTLKMHPTSSSTNPLLTSTYSPSTMSSHLTSSEPLTPLTGLHMEIMKLVEESILLYEETLGLNAQSRQMNSETRTLEVLLLELDANRLQLTSQMNDYQLELTGTHKQHVQCTRNKNITEESIKTINVKYEDCLKKLSEIQGDVEMMKIIIQTLEREMGGIQTKEKNFPTWLKNNERLVTELTQKLSIEEKNLRETRQLLPIFEAELAAIDDQLKAGRDANVLRMKGKIEQKMASLKKAEKLGVSEMQALTTTLNRLNEERRVENGTSWSSRKTDVNKQIDSKRSDLNKVLAKQATVQKELDKIEQEKSKLTTELQKLQKTERRCAHRLSQLSDAYSINESHLALMSQQKLEASTRTRDLLSLQDEISQRHIRIVAQLNAVNVELLEKLGEMQEIKDQREREREQKIEAGVPAEYLSPPHPLLEDKPIPWSCLTEVHVILPAAAALSLASGVFPSPTTEEKAKHLVRKTYTGIVHADTEVFGFENVVSLHYGKEDSFRVCVEYVDIVDVTWSTSDIESIPLFKAPPLKRADSSSFVTIPIAEPISSKSDNNAASSAASTSTSSTALSSSSSSSSSSSTTSNSNNGNNNKSNANSPVSESERLSANSNTRSSRNSVSLGSGQSILDEHTETILSPGGNSPPSIIIQLRPNYNHHVLFSVDSEKSLEPSLTLYKPTKIIIRTDERNLHQLYNTLRITLQCYNNKQNAIASSPSPNPNLSPFALSSNSTGNTDSSSDAEDPYAAQYSEYLREQMEVYAEGTSEILSDKIIKFLIRSLPPRYQLSVWSMPYSMTVHGVSMTQMLRTMAEYPCALLFITDMEDNRFGAYVSQPFVTNAEARNAYYGSGECFIFKLIRKTDEEIRRESLEVEYALNLHERMLKNPSAQQKIDKLSNTSTFVENLTVDEYRAQIYHWQGDNDYFMFTGYNPTFIALGGGGSCAIQLDSDFRKGHSGNCITFRSPMLSSKPDFFVKRFEIWCPTRSGF